jgi:hypothetical protein
MVTSYPATGQGGFNSIMRDSGMRPPPRPEPFRIEGSNVAIGMAGVDNRGGPAAARG